MRFFVILAKNNDRQQNKNLKIMGISFSATYETSDKQISFYHKENL